MLNNLSETNLAALGTVRVGTVLARYCFWILSYSFNLLGEISIAGTTYESQGVGAWLDKIVFGLCLYLILSILFKFSIMSSFIENKIVISVGHLLFMLVIKENK